MLYHFELQMAGVILVNCYGIGGISLWIKRRERPKSIESTSKNDDTPNF